MKASRTARVLSLATAAFAAAALAGCGTPAGQPAQPAAPGTPSTPLPAPVTSPAVPPSSPAVAAGTIVSSRVAYPWNWPNGQMWPGNVRHTYRVPPVPELIAVRAGHHPAAAGERAYNRLSFTFTHAFPTYEFQFVSQIVADGSGKPVTLAGNDAPLRVIFRNAQAHTDSGAPSILTRPPAHLGLSRMVSWVQAGDFEGVVTIGIGIDRPVPHSNPQFPVRAYEAEKVTAQGQHLYVVAIDIDATQPAG